MKQACSKRKLFKTPGSVNYRRMLPYLKDIQEDNPCKPISSLIQLLVAFVNNDALVQLVA